MSATSKLDGSRLLQIGKLLKVGNTHLAAFDDGSGDGATFDRRPKVGVKPYWDEYARIGDNDPPGDPSAAFSFGYLAGAASPQYTFTKAIQFDPQGESRVNSTSSTKPIVEVGLRPDPRQRGGCTEPEHGGAPTERDRWYRQNLPAMKPSIQAGAAFSLVEVTLALGVAAFSLVALFGLLPVGLNTKSSLIDSGEAKS